MVGFGSSLRIARRSGWEGAYLDYESLKLLLSQIEAVYEEEGHRQRRTGEVFVPDIQEECRADRRAGRGGKRKYFPGPSTTRDYRDELFLEPDSDRAYASVDEEERLLSDMLNESDEFLEPQPAVAQPPNFLSYSHQAASSSEDDEEDSQMEGGCGAAVSRSLSTWRPWDQPCTPSSASRWRRGAKAKKRRHNNAAMTAPSLEGEAFFIKGPSVAGVGVGVQREDAFYLSGGENDETTSQLLQQQDDAQRRQQPQPSIFNAPILRTYAGENASLLPTTACAAPATPGSSLYAFSAATGTDSATPPPSLVKSKDQGGVNDALTWGAGPNASPPPGLPNLTSNKKWTEERKRERELRRIRRKRLRAIRVARERRVPRHIRVAHSKARAIAERFLGLLRAETEKVMLFAQSRLGELADTVGSLRFASFDDGNEFSGGGGSASYPFSEGGMHPSASSSDDECGGGHQGLFPWSDTSNDDEDSHVSHRVAAGSLFPEEISGLMGRSSRRSTPRTTDSKASTSRIYHNDNSGRGGNNRYRDATRGTRRKIAHFAELRGDRPVFQRNDHILGEDMLLISAVEETDGYTAVGVELMHVLRFIFVNLIAVRKICRKHDRLLMNRMLGGYYRRRRHSRGTMSCGGSAALGTGTKEDDDDARTLGGLLSRMSGDVYEAHPALLGHLNHFKLVGVYDRKVQKLANSRTVQVISACLAGALSEYEVARTRADALTKLNSSSSTRTVRRSGKGGPPPQIPDANRFPLTATDPHLLLESEDEGGPPSTASCVSLTRLQFTVTSIFSLREAARYKLDHYAAYLARSTMAFAGQTVVGEGLDGCSRETLDFVVSYNPDAALLLDPSVLFRGLKCAQWMTMPLTDIMIASLAAATTPEDVASDVASTLLSLEESVVANAVSILPGPPESRNFLLRHLLGWRFPRPQSPALEGMPSWTLLLSRFSCFLYTMNYFMAHSTTTTFVEATGAPKAHSATIIGAPNLSALLVALLHCFMISRESVAHRFPRDSVPVLRRLFILSSLVSVVGNVLHAVAVERGSISRAVLGRFVIGLGSCEIVSRQLLSVCSPSLLVSESARLTRWRAFGIACGFLVSSLAEAIPIQMDAIGVRSLQSTSWLMAMLWFLQMLGVLLRFRPEPASRGVVSDRSAEASMGRTGSGGARQDSSIVEYDSDSTASDEAGTSANVLFRSSSDVTSDDLKVAYGPFSDPTKKHVNNAPSSESAKNSRQSPSLELLSRKSGIRQFKTFVSRLRKLLMYHVGIPIALATATFVYFSLEVLFTAAPVITSSYFGWSGAQAGVFLGLLCALILPTNFVGALIARRYEERTVIKRSLVVVGLGLFAMINWVSMFSLATRVPKLLTETNGRRNHPYDWKVGIVQYVVGLSISVVGFVSLSGAALSLASKTSPPRLPSVAINVGTISTFLCLAARLLGDVQILMVGLSHKLINTDIVNALVFPMIAACLVVSYFVRKHFFFLM